jgi:hypothetical protein
MMSMTASSTPSCTSLHSLRSARRPGAVRLRARALLAVFLLAVISPAAAAGEITAQKVELRWAEDNFQPVADFSVILTPQVEQALTHGVPLYFTGEFSLIHHRWYWLNDVVSRSEQTVRLSYNALTRQYRVSYGAIYQNFNSLDDALHLLGHQAFDAFAAVALQPRVTYVLSVRMHLELGQLPKPLQINALVNTDWEMDSGWRAWNVNLPDPPDKSSQAPLVFN